MDARIFIYALITAVGSSIPTAPARAQDGDRIEEILPAGVGLFEFQSITLQEFLGMMKVMGLRVSTGESIGDKHYIRSRARRSWRERGIFWRGLMCRSRTSPCTFN